MTTELHRPTESRVWRRDSALIGGAWRPVASTVDVVDPATEQVIGTAANAGGDELDAAVAAARAAFPAWSATPVAQRAELLAALEQALRDRRDLLVDITVAEVGAPVRVARESHVDLSLDIVGYYVKLLRERAAEGDDIGHSRIGNSLVLREPVGVVGAITPWNYPFYQLVIKVVPALAAGCVVVAKPAELTPLTAHVVADAVLEAGLPAGVFNLVPGRGSVVGEALINHPDVDMVSFTGSTPVGQRVAAAAAATLKRVSLELGGKSPSVVLADADLVAAVRSTVDSATLNSGQTCSAWTRLIVPQDRLDEAFEIAAGRVQELVVGDPTSETTDLGPVVSAQQQRSIEEMVNRAAAEGARIVTGTAPDSGVGYYTAPAVVTGLGPEAEIVQQEVFGPVLVIQPYADEDDAVRLANDSEYGLTGAVWSADRERALAVARKLRTGQVDVNGAEFNLAAPFGGYKKSGYGRELGEHGLEEFTEVKSVQL